MIHHHHYGRYNVSIDTEKLLNGISQGNRFKNKESGLEKFIPDTNRVRSITSDSIKHIDTKADIILESSSLDSHLDDFLVQLDEVIHEISEQYGGILHCVEMWEGISSITVMLEPDKMSELMMRIAFFPQVEKVEEGLHFREKPESMEGMIGLSPYARVSCSGNALRVVMKEEIVLGY